MVSLTRSINILPNRYGRLQELNLMPGKGVRTRQIIVEEQNGVLTLLQTLPVGSPGQANKSDKRKVRNFTIPHIPLDDVILPDDYQGVRAFGSENELQAVVQVVNDKLQTMKDKQAITLEHLRMGALKGIILDADGTTLYNLYTEFGIVAKVIDFALDNAETDVPTVCRSVVRHIEDNLQGEVMSGVHCLCSEGFYDGLVSHDSVKQAYLNWSAAGERIGEDLRKGFKFNGIVFEEYRGKATDKDGTIRKFVADDQAHFFPVGTMASFETLFAPADFVETANTLGLELYSKQEPRKFGRGIDLHTQSNPLPICYRPAVLVKGTA
jgi:hypothetical protein